MIQLPPFNDGTERVPRYDYTILLSDVLYRIVLKYKGRVDRWYMTIYDSNDNRLLAGKKLTVNTPLLETYQIEGLPPGEIGLRDTSGAEAECGEQDLGVRCELIYILPSEIPDLTPSYDITIVAQP